MRVGFIATSLLIAGISAATIAIAQTGPTGGSAMATGGSHMGSAMNQEAVNSLADYADRSKRLSKDDKAKGKTLKQVLAEDKVAAAALAKSMALSCDVADAMQVAAGPDTVNGQTVQTQTYEAVCANGMGYFLVSQEPGKPYGFSCFATDATAKADIAEHRKPTETCKLPANADLKLVAGKMLSASGHSCSVKDYRWLGQSAASHIEFDEVACDNGQGFMMIVALPGAQTPVRVETCNESAKHGLPCRLSDNGNMGPTLGSFRDALTKNHVVCDATDKTTHVLGQIAAKKLYVVEFTCAQMPTGLVAYIPQEGSQAPFEAVDCFAAAKRGVICTLSGTRK